MKIEGVKPCPYCHNKEIGEHIHVNIKGEKTFTIECMACRSTGPLGKSVLESIHLWNTRGMPLSEVVQTLGDKR